MMDYTELKKLAEAAPSGPWEYDPNSDSYSGSISNAKGFLIEGEFYGGTTAARFITAASPDVVLGMIAAIDALQARCAELERLTKATAINYDAILVSTQAERDASLARLEALEK